MELASLNCRHVCREAQTATTQVMISQMMITMMMTTWKILRILEI